MKKILFGTIFLANSAFAQYQFRLESGNFKDLKGQTSVNVEFSYEGMIVGDDNKNEAQYVEQNKSQQNTKERGRGDAWEKSWYSNKKEIYEPKFHELLQKYSKIADTEDRNAKYTLLVHVTMLRTGFVGWGLIRSNAKMNADITLAETQNKMITSAKVLAKEVPGRTGSGYDFNASERLRECYAKAAKELGKMIAKMR